MLAYKLDGVPDEYDEYYYRISDEPGGLENSLRSIMFLNDEERKRMGKAAQEYVEKYKNPRTQCAKIISLITNC